MWTETSEDKMLSQTLGNLRLGEGLRPAVMANLPAGIPTPANGAGRALLAASLVGAVVVLLLFGFAWQRLAGAEKMFYVTWLTVSLVSLAVGLFLALGARKLSELDCWLVERLTGRTSVVSGVDIILVRTGALAIFMVAAFWQVTELTAL
ncbi:MAG: hypothetical protein JXA52_00305 [Planctomycetes bacterium]|nr:hypothetical protein [Planctomycetota bacterium]